MKPIQISGILTSMSHTKDGGLRIGFTTQELTKNEMAEMLNYFQKFGYILFKPNEFQDTDIPKGFAEKKGKTMSQLLRNILYRYWEQTNSEKEFELFYREKMEKFIDMVKKQLEV